MERIGLSPEQTARVCAAARAYVGVRVLMQGRSKQGIDCVGIPEMVYIDAGFPVQPERADYRIYMDPRRLLGHLLKYMDKLAPDEALQPGDVVVYGLPREAHVALLVDGKPLNMIHASAVERVVEVRFDPARGNIRGAFRWRVS